MVRAPIALPVWWTCALSIAWSVSALLGCEHTVALGTECPPIGKECIDSTNRPPRDPPVQQIDAGDPPPPRADSGPPEPTDSGPPPETDAGDVEPDAGPPPLLPFPGFINPSFELTAGAPAGGNVALPSVAIDPWLACAVGVVGARPEDDLRNAPIGPAEATDIIRPSHASTLVSMSFGLGPAMIAQVLSEPLQKDRVYGFAIDVVQSGDADARLEIWESSGPCRPIRVLAQSEMITKGQSFAPICLSFTADKAIPSLMLVMSTVGARLFIDNLRPTSECR
jgi:hypothetical protein